MGSLVQYNQLRVVESNLFQLLDLHGSTKLHDRSQKTPPPIGDVHSAFFIEHLCCLYRSECLCPFDLRTLAQLV